MLQEAIDFREESDALYAVLDGLNDDDWKRTTQFKQWTINDVIAHLHFGNYAADLSLKGADAFAQFTRQLSAAGARGIKHKEFTQAWLDGIGDRALANRWRLFYGELAEGFGAGQPSYTARDRAGAIAIRP
ncbi:MAG: maleylpyruvate isomerase N-terminal domain-containing protein [Candidatus Binataceae bacterium]|nr:maleylpyruvate isomerase N-terminal domain-containing protein [Candidatus Binataceae bacterium]